MWESRLLHILSRRSIPARVIHWNCRIWVDHHEDRLRIQHNLRQRALLHCPNQPCSPRPSRQDHHRRPRNRVHSLGHIHLPSRSAPQPTPTTSYHPFPLLQKLGVGWLGLNARRQRAGDAEATDRNGRDGSLRSRESGHFDFGGAADFGAEDYAEAALGSVGGAVIRGPSGWSVGSHRAELGCNIATVPPLHGRHSRRRECGKNRPLRSR